MSSGDKISSRIVSPVDLRKPPPQPEAGCSSGHVTSIWVPHIHLSRVITIVKSTSVIASFGGHPSYAAFPSVMNTGGWSYDPLFASFHLPPS